MTLPTSTLPTPTVTLSDKNYNRLKLTAQLLLPALATLYFALSQIWGLPGGAEVSGTITAVNVFVGVAVAWFKSLHDASGARFDGTMMMEDNEEGTAMRLKDVDVKALDTKDELTFKVVRTPLP